MIRNIFFCVLVAVIGAPVTGHAQPRRAVWDAHGWTNLGERTVNGRMDHDRIEVGRYEGKFSKLRLVVEDADVEVLDVRVEFGDHTDWHPALGGFYREGTRTRVIDVPGGDRVIRFIDFHYRNAPGEWHAKVAMWALRDDAAPPAPPPPPPPAFTWDQRGWDMLGEREVRGHGREEADRIEVGRHEGKFKKLTIVVLDADLEMIDFAVKFERGAPFHPDVKQFFKEGTRTRLIDLPGWDGRAIKWLEFTYRNLPGDGHARVQVWARE